MASPTAREEMRKLVVAELCACKVAPTIESPGDWSVPLTKFPALLIRCGNERKVSLGRNGETQFNTTLVVAVRAAVSGATAEIAQRALDEIGATVEDVILRSMAIRKAVQDFPVVDTTPDYRSDGRQHIASLDIAFHFEVYEAFDPCVPDELGRLVITADLQQPFDATGTYPDPPFPDAIPAAPRTSGPDGRAEGVIDISFPEE